MDGYARARKSLPGQKCFAVRAIFTLVFDESLSCSVETLQRRLKRRILLGVVR